eukprot:GILI01020083.1.p1 GENE.GILI01020083.1~~GILI01020083.1.p1  ORF type:complete len:220 (-),score=54.71 GILI01020083.1:372-989(-)
MSMSTRSAFRGVPSASPVGSVMDSPRMQQTPGSLHDLPEFEPPRATLLHDVGRSDFQSYSHNPTPAFKSSSADQRERWVTVFGFPPSCVSLILNRFQIHGEITNHVSGNGNWIHIQYASSVQAQKALQWNGKSFNGVLMVGVTRCAEESVMGEDAPPSFIMSPAQHAEPLKKARNMDLDLSRPQSSLPHKDTSVFSRVKEFIFNW